MYQERLSVDRELLQAAKRQFCLDIGLDYEWYLKRPYLASYITKAEYKQGTTYPKAEGARCYYGTEAFCKVIVCMGQLFMCVDEQLYDWAVETYSAYPAQWFCEYGNLRRLDEKLREYGRRIHDTHIYFLPAAKQEPVGKCELPVQWFEKDELLRWKENNQFTSAICFSPTQPDMLVVAAMKSCEEKSDMDVDSAKCYKKDASNAAVHEEIINSQKNMAGMAGVSADGDILWQIGINVIPEYAGRGLGVQLVSMLKEEILRRGKVPFYGTSESHTVSQTVGLKAGFAPAWMEIYVKKVE